MTSLGIWITQLFTLFIAILAILVSVQIISMVPIRTYVQDEWVNLTFYFDRGFWASTIYRHNGHPTFFTNLVLRVDWIIFGGSALFRTVVTAGASCAVGLGLIAIAFRNMGWAWRDHPWYLLSGGALIVALSLWLAMGNKLMWTFGLTDHVAALGAIVSAFGLIRLQQNRASVRSGFWLMVLGSTLAMFSFGSGLAVWIAFATILFVTRSDMRVAFSYLLVGGVVIFIVMGLVPGFGIGVGPEATVWTDLGQRVGVVTQVIGGVYSYPLTPFGVAAENRMKISEGFGWLGMLALMYQIFVAKTSVCKNPESRALQAIALFALGAAVLIGIARGEGFGQSIGLAPRYAPISMLFWMCLLALVLRYSLARTSECLYGTDHKWSVVHGTMLTLALFVLSANLVYVFHYRHVLHQSSLAAITLVVDPDPSNKNLTNYYRRSDYMVRVAEHMKADKRGVYRHDFARLVGKRWPDIESEFADVGSCIGTFVVNKRFSQPLSIAIEGWAREAGTELPVDSVAIVHEGVVVGGGMAVPILREESRKQVKSGNRRKLGWNTRARQLLGTLWSPRSPKGWLAVAKVDSASVDRLHLYGVIGSEHLCEINQLERG